MRAVLLVVSTIALAGCARTTMFTSPTSAADTETLLREFSSTVVPGGSASRTFDATTTGIITVVLKSTTPDGVMLGLGVGIPRSNGSCALNAAVEAGPASQISIEAEKGSYCAKVFDLGSLAEPLSFTIAISHP